jgi:hypothetical protein
MTMSSFRVAPREGHLERLRHICGYLVKFKSACIQLRTELLDYSYLPEQDYDWARTVYGNVREQKAEGAPVPQGKVVRMTTYGDANLYHDMATGKAVMGIIHFLNGTTLVEWYTRKLVLSEHDIKLRAPSAP